MFCCLSLTCRRAERRASATTPDGVGSTGAVGARCDSAEGAGATGVIVGCSRTEIHLRCDKQPSQLWRTGWTLPLWLDKPNATFVALPVAPGLQACRTACRTDPAPSTFTAAGEHAGD